VGVVAVVPLLLLAHTHPLGNSWVWFEFPWKVTLLAAALGIWTCFARYPAHALRVPVLTGVIVLGVMMVDEYLGLRRFGRTDLFDQELGLVFELALLRVAPWLMSGLYAVLAALATLQRPKRDPRKRAGLWLVAVGAIAAAVTVFADDWESFDNVSGPGWCDTRIASLVAALIACAAGLALVVIAMRKPASLPRARVVER
jgi:hypothetical protein